MEYLAFAPFTIKTDQKSIKHILEQHLTTPSSRFEFDIQYKKRSLNTAADALSRKESAELLPMRLDNVHHNLFELIQKEWHTATHLQKLIYDLERKPESHPKYTWVRNELRMKGKLVLSSDSPLKSIILKWLHDSALGGHSGKDVTTSRI